MKRVVARALIALAVAGLIASPFAFGVTVTPGSNSPGIAGTPSLDKTTGQVKCVQTPGVTVTLPGSSATAWNACASVTTTYSDYCSNTANGIPCLDSNTKISTSVVPDLSGTYVAGSGTLSGTTYYVPVKTASGWGDSRITDNAASGTTTLAGGTAPGGYPPLLKLTGIAYTGIDLTGATGGFAFSIANNQFFRMANTSGAQQNILGVSSDNVTYLGANSGSSIRIATPLGYGNTNGITVSPTTNYVGIGKTPSDLLDVAGAVGALSLKLNGATSGAVTHGVAATTASYSMLDPATAPAAGQAIVYPAGGGQGTWASVGIITVVCPVGMTCAGKTDTTTSTATATGTGTFYQTSAQPVSATVTATASDTSTLYGINGVGFIGTSTTTATKYGVGSGTGTGTGTGAVTFTGTASGTATDTTSVSDTATVSGQINTNTITVTTTSTSTAVRTQTMTLVVVWYHTPTSTKTSSMSGTNTSTATATVTATVTETATVTATDGSAGTGTATVSTINTGTTTRTSAFTSALAGTATNTTQWTNFATVTITGTWAQTATSTGTGTRTITVLLTQTGTASVTKTGTASLTFTGTATLSVGSTATGTVTDTGYAASTFTATALGTSTSATVASSPTVTYSPPSVPGGDLFLVNGIINTGTQPAPAFTTFPTGDVGTSDLVAAPTSSTPVSLTTLCDNSNGLGSNGGNCSLVNHHGVHSGYTWIPAGNVLINLWARTELNNAAQIKLFFSTCTDGNATGEVSFPTITVNVTTDKWQLLQATLPLPTGLLLKPDYQFCVAASAYTTGVLSTVHLGANYPHYSSVNGPWVNQRAEYPGVTTDGLSFSPSTVTTATTVWTSGKSLHGRYSLSAKFSLTNTGASTDSCVVSMYSNTSPLDSSTYKMPSGGVVEAWLNSVDQTYSGTEKITLNAYAAAGSCTLSNPGGSDVFTYQAMTGWIR
jgi:hypothetical protein